MYLCSKEYLTYEKLLLKKLNRNLLVLEFVKEDRHLSIFLFFSFFCWGKNAFFLFFLATKSSSDSGHIFVWSGKQLDLTFLTALRPLYEKLWEEEGFEELEV